MTLKVSRIKRYRYSLLWMREHFFGSKKAAINRRKLLSKKISNNLKMGKHNIPVPEIEGVSVDEFIKNYRNKSQPVVLKKAAKDWPFYDLWTPEYFARKYPEDPVILFDATIESRKSPREKLYKKTTVEEFVSEMNNGSKDYARFLPLLDNHPEILEDFDLDWLVSAADKRAKGKKFQLFMGGKDTSTSMHCAIGSNLFIQVHGRKQWWIYSNRNSPLMEPIMDRSVFFRSEANAEEPTGTFEKAHGWTTILEPGDILYNPPFYWHQARNLDTNIGVGFRWFSLSSILKVSPTQLLMTLTASNPSIKDAKKMDGNFAKVYSEMLKVK